MEKRKIKNYKTPQKSSGWVAYQLEEQIKQPGYPKNRKAGRTIIIKGFPTVLRISLIRYRRLFNHQRLPKRKK